MQLEDESCSILLKVSSHDVFLQAVHGTKVALDWSKPYVAGDKTALRGQEKNIFGSKSGMRWHTGKWCQHQGIQSTNYFICAYLCLAFSLAFIGVQSHKSNLQQTLSCLLTNCCKQNHQDTFCVQMVSPKKPKKNTHGRAQSQLEYNILKFYTPRNVYKRLGVPWLVCQRPRPTEIQLQIILKQVATFAFPYVAIFLIAGLCSQMTV